MAHTPREPSQARGYVSQHVPSAVCAVARRNTQPEHARARGSKQKGRRRAWALLETYSWPLAVATGHGTVIATRPATWLRSGISAAALAAALAPLCECFKSSADELKAICDLSANFSRLHAMSTPSRRAHACFARESWCEEASVANRAAATDAAAQHVGV